MLQIGVALGRVYRAQNVRSLQPSHHSLLENTLACRQLDHQCRPQQQGPPPPLHQPTGTPPALSDSVRASGGWYCCIRQIRVLLGAHEFMSNRSLKKSPTAAVWHLLHPCCCPALATAALCVGTAVPLSSCCPTLTCISSTLISIASIS